MGEEEGPAEGRESPDIKENQSEKTKTEKTEKIKKLDYYKAHKNMHSMYADTTVKDIYDVISDDTIDLNRFACMCDSFGLFYSEDSTAAVLSSKISENQGLPNKHNHTQTLPHIDLCHHNTLPSKVGTRCGVDCALDAGGTSPKSGPEGGRIDEAEKQLFEQGPHGPTTTPQAAPNPILSGCGVDTNESEGMHTNGGHVTVDIEIMTHCTM